MRTTPRTFTPASSRFWLAVVLLLASASQAEPLVLENGTVHSLAGDPFTGKVVIEDGLITAAGPEAEAPDGARRLDVSGLHVYPGIFDAFSTLGLTEINAVAATVDTAELGAYNPHLMAATAVHPASEVIPVTRANGITHALTAPRTRQGGVIAGQAALIQLDGWTIEEMAIQPSIAMVIQWPAIQTRIFDRATFTRRTVPYNEARDKAEEARAELRDWLEAARHYAQASAADEPRVVRDLKLEALARVTAGTLPAVLLANAERDIKAAVEFAEREEIDIVLVGGRDAWKVKEMLAEKNIPVILGRAQSLPAEDDDPYDRPFRNAGELQRAGVRIAFGSAASSGFGPGGPHSARTLPWESATTAAFGLSRDEALRAITAYPAEILGVGDRLGTIESGKIANLMITDGDPLEITTRVVHLVIAGREVSTDNRHRGLYERYRSRP